MNKIILFLCILFLTGCHYKFIGPNEYSMYPSLAGGDTVYVDERFPFSQLKIRDIVIMYPEGEDFAVVHRIIDEIYIQGEKHFILQGDNNHEPDEWLLSEETYRGKIIKVIFN